MTNNSQFSITVLAVFNLVLVDEAI
jgi:hypothetical protein